MTFATRSVTRHGRPMVLLIALRGGSPLPVGYFLPNKVAQAKVDFCNKVAELSA